MSGEKAEKPARRFQVARPSEWPEGALIWKSATEKGHKRRAWREGIIRRYAEHARVLRLCWVLESLTSSRGYAFATDAALGSQSNLAVNKVQEVLSALEQEGAIVRCHVPNGAAFQRRIFLGAKPAATAHDTPHRGGTPIPPTVGLTTPPTVGGQKRKEESNRRGLGATLDAARADAERREARARGDAPNAWLLEDDEAAA